MQKQEETAEALALGYRKGSVVEAKVLLVKSFEAVVELDHNAIGIIRNRELSWGREPEHAREVVQKGQKIKVMILGMDRDKQRLKLSLRLAERDPWRDIRRHYKIGQTVRGKVTGLLSKVAFVELEQAVEGCVPLREVCTSPPDRVDKIIWIGDTIEAIITHLKPGARRVVLSIKKRLAQLRQHRELALHRRLYLKNPNHGGAPLIELLSDEGRLALLSFIKGRREVVNETEERRENAHTELASRMKRVLIADDDASFRISLQCLLKRLGHEVEAVDSAEKAVGLCAERRFDLVLMDLSFPRGSIGGLRATRDIALINRGVPVLILTGLVNSYPHEDIAARAKSAGAKGILLKPVDLRSLTHQMTSIVEGRDCWDAEPSVGSAGAISYLSPRSVSSPSHVDFQRAVNRELLKLQRETEATACVLFQMTLSTRVVRVLANTGTPLTGYEAKKYTLQSTPIYEVIRQGMEVFEEDTSRNPWKFKYLNLVNYASCIGVPVKTFGQTRYGVFLFHNEKGHFTREHLTQARVATMLIRAVIDREEIVRVIQRAQPLIFAGQIGSMLIHELNNRLSSVLNYTETLLVEHEAIEKDISEAIDPRLRSRIRTCVQNLENNTRAMEKITSLYLGLMSVERREAGSTKSCSTA
ncbi:MAG: S1 RNA-binding domain-containing protein [Acidobacteria bacterium]|nr:S1 RNA-binding domain-containing protein [Acidobacteriota bacterium]